MNTEHISKEVAEQFLTRKDTLGLSRFSSMDDAAAEILSRYDGGELYLDGLATLSEVVAESLSKFKGELWLGGINELSDTAFKYLSKVEGSLQLSSLTSLSDTAAKYLSNHRGGLYLNGLGELSDYATKCLSSREIGLSPVIEELNVKDCEGWARPMLPENPQKAVYDALMATNQCSLSLDGLTKLSDTALGYLSKHKGRLDLNGLTTLTDAAAESLSKHEGFVDVIEIRQRISGSLVIDHDYDAPGMLCLNGITKLSDNAAAALSKHKGSLFLGGITKLSKTAAEYFSQGTGKINGWNRMDWPPVANVLKKKATKKKATKKKASKKVTKKKPLFTKTQIRNISKYAPNCVMQLERLLRSIEEKKDSKKVCFPSLFNLYWVDSNWIAHGKGFEGKPPKVKKTISKKDIIHFISDRTVSTQKETSRIISSLDEIIVNRVSACGAKMEKFDLFARGTLVVEAGKLSFTSANQTLDC